MSLYKPCPLPLTIGGWGDLALNNTRKHIGSIVMAVSLEQAAKGGEVGVELRPALRPIAWHADGMEHRG